jgi:hypothetical protein
MICEATYGSRNPIFSFPSCRSCFNLSSVACTTVLTPISHYAAFLVAATLGTDSLKHTNFGVRGYGRNSFDRRQKNREYTAFKPQIHLTSGAVLSAVAITCTTYLPEWCHYVAMPKNVRLRNEQGNATLPRRLARIGLILRVQGNC